MAIVNYYQVRYSKFDSQYSKNTNRPITTSEQSSMKLTKQKSPPQPQHTPSSSRSQPQHHNLLQYYKSKIDSLYNQRLAWLSKFDECKSRLTQKHSLKQKLLQQRHAHRDLTRAIVHHEVALLDQRLNVIRMDRENLMHDYRDAQEVVKIGDIMEQYPQEIERMLPCNLVNGSNRMGNGDVIRNQLNIHTSKQKKPTSTSRSTKKPQPNSFNIKHSLSQKHYKQYDIINPRHSQSTSQQPPQKITQQQLLQRQLIELQQNHATQLQTMRQLKCKLQQLIRKTKQQEKQKLSQEREIVTHLNQQHKDLQKRHKDLAEDYFAGRRKQKLQQEQLQKEKEQLIKKNQVFEDKVSKEMKVYEKENKARQILILKKSQDFQQNYKAKMRAKERNLQALKENYQKMQTICIQKVTKLQKALNKSKTKLKQSEQRKQFLVDQLREQLHTLEKRVQEQKLQREQRELKMRIKAQKQKVKQQQEKERRQKEQAKAQRNRLVQQSYKRTLKKPQKSLSKDRNSRSKKSLTKPAKPIPPKQKDIYGKPGEESQDDESLEMDDLENIRRQIGELETKIAADTK